MPRFAPRVVAPPRAPIPTAAGRRALSTRCAAPPAAASTKPDAIDDHDPSRMVWTLARLPLAQRLSTSAVALGKLASEAGSTYTTIIGAKLLVSRELRFQDAFLTIGLTMGGNLLQLLEAQWEIELERQFQATMVPWLAQRRAQDVPHDAATFDALGKLTQARAVQWVEAAGLIGRLGSSLYAAVGQAHQVPRTLLAVMVGISVLRHGLGAWWTQRIQQRVTDWTLERRRATFGLLRGAGQGLVPDITVNTDRLSGNRTQRLRLKRASIGVETVQEALLLLGCYGMFWRLGWFAPKAPLETLVAIQTGMAAAQALVGAILMVPLFVVGQVQMHTQVQTYLRAEAN